jgi:hypothetical protein
MIPKRGRGRGDDRGQAAVEFAGLISIVVVCFLAALQLLLAGYCVVVQDGAVRAAAEANAQGGDPDGAARAAMPGWLADRADPAVVAGERVEIGVRVPSLLPGLDIAKINRSAVFHRR